MNYAIEKSGTGIERSGTGIERSDTGIERSGTGSRLKHAAIGIGAAIGLTITFSVSAMEPQVLVTRSADNVLVSVHSGHSMLVGSLRIHAASSYTLIDLYEVTSETTNSSLLVNGSGGGTPGASCSPAASNLMVNGSGGGAPGKSCSPESSSLMVNGSGGGTPESSCSSKGSGLMVNGSGGGTPGSSCNLETSSLMVNGSGGGTPAATCNPGGENIVMVNGSGGGASSDGEADCMNKIVPWGSAELVFDPEGTSVIIHRNSSTGPEEFMVEFIAGTPLGATEFDPQAASADSRFQLRSITLH